MALRVEGTAFIWIIVYWSIQGSSCLWKTRKSGKFGFHFKGLPVLLLTDVEKQERSRKSWVEILTSAGQR